MAKDAEDLSHMEMEEACDISAEHIEQVIDCDAILTLDSQCSSDGEDQQSTSNLSDVGVQVITDDSSYALQAHEQDCFAIAVAAERWLASGGEDDVSFLWDQHVSDTDPVKKIAHDDSVTHVAFNNSQTLLATGDMSGKIIVTQLSDLNIRTKLSDCNDLEWLCWHNTSDILFAGDKDGIVWMWLIGPSGVVQSKVYGGCGFSCTDAQLLPDGKRLLTGYADGSVKLWNLKDGTCISLSLGSAITAMHHHVSQPVGAVGTENGNVHLVNTAHQDRLPIVAVLPALSEPAIAEESDEVNVEVCVECVQFAPFNSWLAVGRNDGTLCIYDTASTIPRSIYRAPLGKAIDRALWSMEDNMPLLCVGSVDGFVRLFDARDGSLYKELGNGADEVLDMVLLGSNPLRIMTAGSGGVIRLFDLSKL